MFMKQHFFPSSLFFFHSSSYSSSSLSVSPFLQSTPASSAYETFLAFPRRLWAHLHCPRQFFLGSIFLVNFSLFPIFLALLHRPRSDFGFMVSFKSCIYFSKSGHSGHSKKRLDWMATTFQSIFLPWAFFSRPIAIPYSP